MKWICQRDIAYFGTWRNECFKQNKLFLYSNTTLQFSNLQFNLFYFEIFHFIHPQYFHFPIRFKHASITLPKALRLIFIIFQHSGLNVKCYNIVNHVTII